jgi:hypothetical protein
VSHGRSEEPASRSGHAADRINELLTDKRMIGDAEQYAVAAALMAREVGFGARVVFGFVPTAADASSGSLEVRGEDVSAWIEVDTAEYGWVTVDPNPPAREIPDATPDDPTTIARPESVVAPPAADPAPAQLQATPETLRDDPDDAQQAPDLLRVVLTWAATAAAGILVLLAPFLAIVFAKTRRRRLRRRAPTNLERISGGWREFEDTIIDHGYQPPPAATRSEVAALLGGTRAAVLAAVVDRAVFAPAQPDAVEADRVWKVVSDLAVALNANATRWQRLKARVSIASLGGYSGRTRIKR